MTDRPRIISFNPSNLAPYHAARFRALVERGVELTVATCPVPEHPRPWSIDRSAVPFAIHAPFGERPLTWLSAIRAAHRYLRDEQPDAVFLVGYSSRYMLAAAGAARRAGIPTVLVLVGWRHERRRNRLVEAVKRGICKRLFDHALVPGIRGEEYATWLGVRPASVFRVGNVVDNEHFATGATTGGARTGFVSLTRFAEAKNLPRLLEAYERYRSSGGTWPLDLYGTGPLEGVVRAMADRIAGVTVHDWARYEHVPAVLWAAGAALLVSDVEPWGLAVNEAMAASTPVIVSRTCGCYPELCRPGVTGWGVDPTSVVEIAEALQRVEQLSDSARQVMGAACYDVIRSHSLESWANGVGNATSTIIRRSGA